MSGNGCRRAFGSCSAGRSLLATAFLLAVVAGCSRTVSPTTGGQSPTGKAASKQPCHANSAVNSSGAPLKRIILLTNGNSPFWDAARAGMQDAERELKIKDAGLRAVMEVNDGSPGGQLEKLQQAGSQSDVAGIAVSALDADNVAIGEELRRLHQKGIKVVTFDSDIARDKFRDARFAFIGTDNFVGGKELGACAKGLRPAGGGYVTFVGVASAQNAKERITGFTEGAGPKFHSLDSMVDSVDPNRARENVRNAIVNHKDKLTTLVGIWSYNAPAIVDVVKELGKRKNYTIVVFDAEPITISEIAAGNVDAMVVQNPYQMGFQAVRLLRALEKDDQATVKQMFPEHGKTDGDLYDTGLKVVVPRADSPLKKEMFGPKTEFLTLEVFKAWLTRYGLQGS